MDEAGKGFLLKIRDGRRGNKKTEAPPSNAPFDIVAAFQGKDFTPPPSSNLASGMSALLQSNDCGSPEFYNSIRERRPDGYIVGVGAGAIFSLVECFDKEKPPKGIVIADVKPRVVLFSRFLIDKLARSESFGEFRNNFFQLTDEEYRAQIDIFLQQQEGGDIYKPLTENSFTFIDVDKGVTPRHLWRSYEDRKGGIGPFHPHDEVQPIDVLQDNYDLLHQLALQNRITAVYSDISDESFIKTVKHLPDFKKATNIVYISNVADFMHHISDRDKRAKQFNKLKAFSGIGRRTIFVDAAKGIKLRLKAYDSLPVI